MRCQCRYFISLLKTPWPARNDEKIVYLCLSLERAGPIFSLPLAQCVCGTVQRSTYCFRSLKMYIENKLMNINESEREVELRLCDWYGMCEYRSVRQVALYEWHTVRFTRQGRRGRLQVDDQPVVLGTSRGSFTQLTLSLDLFVGGHRNFDEVARLADVQHGFQGCVQKVRTACTSCARYCLFLALLPVIGAGKLFLRILVIIRGVDRGGQGPFLSWPRWCYRVSIFCPWTSLGTFVPQPPGLSPLVNSWLRPW